MRSVKMLFTVLVGVTTVVFGILLSLHISAIFSSKVSGMAKEHLKHVAVILSSTLKPAFDFGDEKEIKRVANILYNQEDVNFVGIYDANRKAIVSLGSLDEPGRKLLQAGLHEVSRSEGHEWVGSTNSVMLGIRAVEGEQGKIYGFLVMGHSLEGILSTKRMLTYSTLLIILLFLFVEVVIFLLVNRYAIVGAINNLDETARKVSEGDLRIQAYKPRFVEFEGIAKSFNDMISTLREQIEGLRNLSETLVERSKVMMEAASTLAAAANEQASATSETVVTVEELKKTSAQVHEMARQIAENAKDAVSKAEDSREGISVVVENMNAIRDAGQDIVRQIDILSDKIQAITEINETVKEISERSNILAINAAIEAAKAGEQGLGFAIVADEVKALAEQSRQGTMRVMELLKELEGARDSLIRSVRNTNDIIMSGVRSLHEASETIMQLIAQVEGNMSDAQQISAASNQQQIGMEQIAAAIQSIADASNSTTESAANVKESGEKLASLADELQKWVDRYKS